MPKKKTKSDVQLAAFSKLTRQWLLTAPVEEMDDMEAAGAWLQLDLIEALAKDRKEQLRQKYLERLPEIGETNEKGSFIAEIDGTTLTKEKRVAKLPDEELVKRLLKEKDLNISECFDQETKWVMNPSKIQFLVEGGKLPSTQLEESKKVTWAFKVKASGAVKDFLATTKKALLKAKKR